MKAIRLWELTRIHPAWPSAGNPFPLQADDVKHHVAFVLGMAPPLGCLGISAAQPTVLYAEAENPFCFAN
jgi:hypothetical protein